MDSYTEKTTKGLGTNLKDSIMGVLIGILLFLASFVVLWINEGRLDMSKVAKKAEVLAPTPVNPAMNGKWVSLSAPVTLTGNLEDPLYLNPGPYLKIIRKAEMYAWVEKKTSKEEKKTGGSTETTTTYDYKKEWVNAEDVKDSSSFKIQRDHENPTPTVKSDTFSAAQAMIGGYSFSPKDAELPPGTPLPLTQDVLKPGYIVQDSHIYIAAFNPGINPTAAPGAAPAVIAPANLGDIRISFQVLRAPQNGTIFGTVSNGSIIPYVAEDGDSFLRLFNTDRESSIKLLSAEYTLMTWILRGLGFLMMWIGLQMFFGPINTLLDIIPFLGSAGRFLVGAVIFPIALVLTIITILISVIFHNIYLLIGVLVLLVVGVVLRGRNKKSATR
jgi:hypothetical protein